MLPIYGRHEHEHEESLLTLFRDEFIELIKIASGTSWCSITSVTKEVDVDFWHFGCLGCF